MYALYRGSPANLPVGGIYWIQTEAGFGTEKKITVILEMTPLLNSVAFASLVGSTLGDMIRKFVH